MRCIACYLVVDEGCPRCRELYERHKDFVELLKNRGCVAWNLSRWGYPAPYFDIADNVGGVWAVSTPMLLVVVHGEGGDRVLYRRPLEVDRVEGLRQFILDDISAAFHRAYREGVKKCYERRGRKGKKRAEEGEGHE